MQVASYIWYNKIIRSVKLSFAVALPCMCIASFMNCFSRSLLHNLELILHVALYQMEQNVALIKLVLLASHVSSYMDTNNHKTIRVLFCYIFKA